MGLPCFWLLKWVFFLPFVRADSGMGFMSHVRQLLDDVVHRAYQSFFVAKQPVVVQPTSSHANTYSLSCCPPKGNPPVIARPTSLQLSKAHMWQRDTIAQETSHTSLANTSPLFSKHANRTSCISASSRQMSVDSCQSEFLRSVPQEYVRHQGLHVFTIHYSLGSHV